MSSKYAAFVALHVPGAPFVLFNAWDAGSAQAVEKAGAPAIATGSWSVAAAQGYPDGEGLPLDMALANARRIVAAVDLPVSIDFEAGYAADPGAVAANFARLAETGAIGANFEDGFVDGSGIHDTAVQARRIAGARSALGPTFFLNTRTDLFLRAEARSHNAAMADAAIARANAYAEAGGDGFFIPGLTDLALVERIATASPLPVNVMAFPGAPSAAAFAGAGVARISHGPHPYRLAMRAIEETARAFYAS